MKRKHHFQVSFMTWNIYEGAEVTPLLTATPAQIPERVTEVFRQFLATNFPQRVKAIARQIVLKKPDLIGLQEAAVWELIPPNSRSVVYDFVKILLRALKRQGLHYRVAAQNRNFTAELPSSTGNLVRLTDRDVILVRKQKKVKVLRKMTANFKTNVQIQIAGQPFTILRGWSAIDVKVHGRRKFRLVNTHLDPDSPAVQIAQANELLTGPGATKLPVVFTGDFNSNPNGSGTQTYGNLIAAGFQDTWVQSGKGNGFTCCQDPDLLSATSLLNERIDLILFKEKKDWKAIKAELVGEAQRDRTPTRLWPSDHAGVVATLQLRRGK